MYLAARGLREPQRPFVLKRVLDVEVVLVVEYGDGLARVNGIGIFLSVRGDGDRRQVDLLVHVDGFRGGGSHDCYVVYEGGKGIRKGGGRVVRCSWVRQSTKNENGGISSAFFLWLFFCGSAPGKAVEGRAVWWGLKCCEIEKV